MTATNVSTSVSRGCSVGGCFPQNTLNTTTTCCNTDLCNNSTTTPPITPPTNRICYFCSTTGNTTADPCYAGTTSSPIMATIQCGTGVSYCYRETLKSKFLIDFLFF